MLQPDPHHLAERAARLGVRINLMLPAAIALAAYALHAARIVPTVDAFTSDPPFLFITFGVVALGELVAALVVRRSLFSRERFQPIRTDPVRTEQWILRSSLIVFAIGASPMIYGAILYLFSGDLRQLAFFGIVTLLAYRLLRPTADHLADLLELKTSTTGVN